MKTIYRIETPGGYLLGRVECESPCAYEQAQTAAAACYSVFKIEKETDEAWLKAYQKNQVTL